MTIKADVVIIGAGPAGLCFAKSLADSGLQVVVLERQSESSLASPAFDGREIALTHHSAELMRELGLWSHISPGAISPLRDARVFNGTSLFSMDIGHRDTQKTELGYLISNHLIREAAYQAANSSPAISIKSKVEVTNIKTDADSARVTLNTGETIQAKLLIGADSRFSETRRAMGIAADMHE